jgi:hypothetical protein
VVRGSLKKLVAVLFMALGIVGGSAATAAAIPIHVNAGINGDTDDIQRICININVTLFGNTIGTGHDETCIP